MQRAFFAAVVAIAVGAGSAVADRPANGQQTFDISGVYSSNWGLVTLRQNGNKVTGTYVFQRGVIDGTLDGNMLRYTWRERDGSGRGIWVVASNGELIGTWGSGTDDLGGGGWRLTPAKPTASIAN